MTLDDLVRRFGSVWKTCMVLGLRGQNASIWKRNGRIPITQQMRIEIMTKGELKADEYHFHRANRKD